MSTGLFNNILLYEYQTRRQVEKKIGRSSPTFELPSIIWLLHIQNTITFTKRENHLQEMIQMKLPQRHHEGDW